MKGMWRCEKKNPVVVSVQTISNNNLSSIKNVHVCVWVADDMSTKAHVCARACVTDTHIECEPVSLCSYHITMGKKKMQLSFTSLHRQVCVCL